MNDGRKCQRKYFISAQFLPPIVSSRTLHTYILFTIQREAFRTRAASLRTYGKRAWGKSLIDSSRPQLNQAEYFATKNFNWLTTTYTIISQVRLQIIKEIHQTNAHLAGLPKPRLQAVLNDERTKRPRDSACAKPCSLSNEWAQMSSSGFEGCGNCKIARLELVSIK